MSDSDSATELTTDRSVKRLRNVLFTPRRSKRGSAHTLAVEAQQLNENAKAFVSRIGEELVVDIPKELKETALPETIKQDLDTSDHQRYLEDQTYLVIQERQREIEETQRRLDQALKELAISKQEEEQILQQKVLECQQEYLESMSNLQTQFIRQADDLKMATMTQLAQYRSQCETNIESRAKSLCASLATDSRACSPSPRSSKASPLHSRLEGLHRKVTEEKKSTRKIDAQLSSELGNESSRRSSDRRLSNRLTQSTQRPKDISFKVHGNESVPVRSSSGARRSFLELLESDEE